MLRLLLLLFVSLFFAACQSTWVAPTATCELDPDFSVRADHPKAAKLQSIMDEYVSKGIPGVIVLVDDSNGTWVGSSGYADLEQGLEMQGCHINKLGSVTKMMMGAVAWQLVQDGELDIEAPLSQYLPDLAAELPFGDQIKVYMLLNHSSGIYDIARDLGYNLAVVNDFPRVWTEEAILEYVDGREPSHEPGTAIRYSNTNTLVVGLVIEAITGKPHAEVLQERIFDRLGMEKTAYYDYDGEFPHGELAQGYLDFNNDGGAIQNISAMNPGNGNGFTGVYSTVTDLYRFAHALLREQTLTTPENLAVIFNSMDFNDSNGNWQSSWGGIHNEYRDILPEDQPAYGHAGGDLGYSAALNYLPHNNTVYAATFNYGTNLGSDLGGVLSEMRRKLLLVVAE